MEEKLRGRRSDSRRHEAANYILPVRISPILRPSILTNCRQNGTLLIKILLFASCKKEKYCEQILKMTRLNVPPRTNSIISRISAYRYIQEGVSPMSRICFIYPDNLSLNYFTCWINPTSPSIKISIIKTDLYSAWPDRLRLRSSMAE